MRHDPLLICILLRNIAKDTQISASYLSRREQTSMLEIRRISYQCEQLGQVPASISTLVTPYATVTRHRAATTGATPFIQLLLASESTGSFKKPRLNLQDRAGNTPLHLGRSDLVYRNGYRLNCPDSYREWSRRSRSRLVSTHMYFLPASHHLTIFSSSGLRQERTDKELIPMGTRLKSKFLYLSS